MIDKMRLRYKLIHGLPPWTLAECRAVWKELTGEDIRDKKRCPRCDACGCDKCDWSGYVESK